MNSSLYFDIPHSLAVPCYSTLLQNGHDNYPDTGGSPSTDWTPINPGNDIAFDGIEDVDVDLANPVFAFGFDFVEPSVDCPIPRETCFDSTFEVTILDGLTSVGDFTFNAQDDVLAFVGVWSDLAFNRVEIRELTATSEDEYFGEFYTSTTPIPIPPAVYLFGTGLLGLVGVARRKKG